MEVCVSSGSLVQWLMRKELAAQVWIWVYQSLLEEAPLANEVFVRFDYIYIGDVARLPPGFINLSCNESQATVDEVLVWKDLMGTDWRQTPLSSSRFWPWRRALCWSSRNLVNSSWLWLQVGFLKPQLSHWCTDVGNSWGARRTRVTWKGWLQSLYKFLLSSC